MGESIVVEIFDDDEAELGCCDGGTCFDGVDALADSVHVKFLRIFGVIAIVFSIIEAALGGSIYGFLENTKLGVWWVGILAFVTGILAIGSNNRGWATATCVFASISALIAAIGAAVEGASMNVFSSLTACSSKDASDVIYNYGSPKQFLYSNLCLAAAGDTLVRDGCYCVAPDGLLCAEYTLSRFVKSYRNNCANILVDYTKLLKASLAFCILTAICMIVLAMISCVVICCPNRSPLNQNRKPKRSDPAPSAPDEIVVGVVGKGTF